MRLAKLTGLEQEKLAAEYGELCNEIARLRNILANENVLFDLIVMELEEIKAKYGDKRKTEIVANDAEIADEDMIQEEDMVVTISHAGYIKRTHPSAYRAQKRGGKGKIGMEAREEDWVTQLFVASTHAYVFFFSDRGKVYVKKVFEIPIAPRTAKGRAIVNFVGMEPGEKVAAIVEVPKIEEGKFVATITKRGQIKKTEVTEYENFRQKGIIGVKIEGDDQLLSAALTDGTREFLIATKMGQSIRFHEDQVRAMGRGTVGVKAIDVADDDQVVGMAVTEPERAVRARGLREGLRQAHAARGVPPAEPRRQGHHPHRRERPQRSGRRHQAGQGRRRDHAHHRQAARRIRTASSRSARRVATPRA